MTESDANNEINFLYMLFAKPKKLNKKDIIANDLYSSTRDIQVFFNFLIIIGIFKGDLWKDREELYKNGWNFQRNMIN